MPKRTTAHEMSQQGALYQYEDSEYKLEVVEVRHL